MDFDEPIEIEDTKVYSVSLSHPEGYRKSLKWKEVERCIKKIQNEFNQDRDHIEGSGTFELVGMDFEEFVRRLKKYAESK